MKNIISILLLSAVAAFSADLVYTNLPQSTDSSTELQKRLAWAASYTALNPSSSSSATITNKLDLLSTAISSYSETAGVTNAGTAGYVLLSSTNTVSRTTGIPSLLKSYSIIGDTNPPAILTVFSQPITANTNGAAWSVTDGDWAYFDKTFTNSVSVSVGGKWITTWDLAAEPIRPAGSNALFVVTYASTGVSNATTTWKTFANSLSE